MKTLIGCVLLLAAVDSQSAIYVCQDMREHISYQDTPCAVTSSIGQLKNIPDAPIADQLRVQARIQSANAKYQQRMAMIETERLQNLALMQQAQALAVEYQKLALLEQQMQQARDNPPYFISYQPARYWHRGHRLGTPNVRNPAAKFNRQDKSIRQFRSRVVTNHD